MSTTRYENDHCPNCGSTQRIKVEYDPTGTRGPSYTCTRCNENINWTTRAIKAVWAGLKTAFNAACAANKWVDTKMAEGSYQLGFKDFVDNKPKNWVGDKYYEQGWNDAKQNYRGPR